jgi:uncharacterized protein with NRDE domain
MCTLIVLHRCVPGFPLVVAANRDEFADRPAEGPALRQTPTGAIAAPRDARAGGTWLGINASGVFAAVTNRRCEEPDPSRRSRGLLVMDALEASRAAEAAERLEDLKSGLHNPFNLFVADASAAFVVTYEDAPRCLPLDPGVFVLGNVDPTGVTPKTARLHEVVEKARVGRPETLLDRLAGICRGHDGSGDPLGDTCVHAGAYGTRSSTLLGLAEGSGDDDLRFCDGPPCENEYEDFTPLLLQLGRGSSVGGEAFAMRKVS